MELNERIPQDVKIDIVTAKVEEQEKISTEIINEIKSIKKLIKVLDKSRFFEILADRV